MKIKRKHTHNTSGQNTNISWERDSWNLLITCYRGWSVTEGRLNMLNAPTGAKSSTKQHSWCFAGPSSSEKQPCRRTALGLLGPTSGFTVSTRTPVAVEIIVKGKKQSLATWKSTEHIQNVRRLVTCDCARGKEQDRRCFDSVQDNQHCVCVFWWQQHAPPNGSWREAHLQFSDSSTAD